MSAITLFVNGETHRLTVEPTATLLGVLRDRLGLVGTKLGCNQGVCGACTVLHDGKAARSCLTLAAGCDGIEIVTIEGLAEGVRPSVLQQAFIDSGAVQCGFCTPGMLIAAKALLDANPKPSVEEIRKGIAGNLCRCSGYVKIVEAVQRASDGIAS